MQNVGFRIPLPPVTASLSLGQEGPCPVLMGREEAKEPRPLGEAGKQRTFVKDSHHRL
jgi:hypothetical protein